MRARACERKRKRRQPPPPTKKLMSGYARTTPIGFGAGLRLTTTTPTWDYTVDFYYRTHPLFLQAEASMQSICESAAASDLPFANGRVYPVHLNGAVAMFISGTSAEPVVLVDIDAHLAVDEDERRRAVADSVLHELRHAVQEANEWPPDEDEAEHGSERIPF